MDVNGQRERQTDREDGMGPCQNQTWAAAVKTRLDTWGMHSNQLRLPGHVF